MPLSITAGLLRQLRRVVPQPRVVPPLRVRPPRRRGALRGAPRHADGELAGVCRMLARATDGVTQSGDAAPSVETFRPGELSVSAFHDPGVVGSPDGALSTR